MHPILRFFHVMGVAMYFGAVLGAGTVLRDAGQLAARSARQLFRLANAGLVLLLLSGLAAVVQLGMGATMRRPSIHVMVTAWLVAGALTGIASSRTNKLSAGALGPEAREGIARLAWVQAVVAAIAVAAGIWRL